MKPVRLMLAGMALFVSYNSFAQPKLEKKWSSDTTLKVPESVLFHKKSGVLYVANIDGQPAEKDGKGSIGKLKPDGTIVAVDWVTGLEAPKGMAISGNSLWVADVDQLVEIDLAAGSIKQKIPVEGASFLNDVTASPDGTIYVSDTKEKKVFFLKKGTIKLFVDNLQGPNGLLYHQGSLYVLDNGSLLKVNKDRSTTRLATGMDGSTDGIEAVSPNAFLVSCWSGVIYYVTSDGKTSQLLDTREQKINSADIGYDPATHTVFVPTFWKNNVVAYTLDLK